MPPGTATRLMPSKGNLYFVEAIGRLAPRLPNLLTAGDEAPVARALERMLAMRSFMRGRPVDGVERPEILRQAGITAPEVEDMYRIMAIANYEDRFVIPTTHREYAEDAFDLRGSCGFTLGNPADQKSGGSLFGGKRKVIAIKEQV